MKRPVVITAVASWTPGGVSVGGLPRIDATGSALGPWSDAPKLDVIHKRARRPSGTAKAAVQLAHALFETRRKLGPWNEAETAICIGSMSGCASSDAEFADGLGRKGEAFGSPATFVYTLPTTVLGEIAIALSLRSEITSTSAGYASGVVAMNAAAGAIASGRAEAVLCGGIEAGSLGARRVFAQAGKDSLVFFMMEAESPGKRALLTIHDWSSGFGDAPFVDETPRDFLSNGPLLELASAASLPEPPPHPVGPGLVPGHASDRREAGDEPPPYVLGRGEPGNGDRIKANDQKVRGGVVACAAPEGFWARLAYRRGE